MAGEGDRGNARAGIATKPAVDDREQGVRVVARKDSSGECIAQKAEPDEHPSLALPFRSTSNEMEFSGERSESAATTG